MCVCTGDAMTFNLQPHYKPNTCADHVILYCPTPRYRWGMERHSVRLSYDFRFFSLPPREKILQLGLPAHHTLLFRRETILSPSLPPLPSLFSISITISFYDIASHSPFPPSPPSSHNHVRDTFPHIMQQNHKKIPIWKTSHHFSF